MYIYNGLRKLRRDSQDSSLDLRLRLNTPGKLTMLICLMLSYYFLVILSTGTSDPYCIVKVDNEVVARWVISVYKWKPACAWKGPCLQLKNHIWNSQIWISIRVEIFALDKFLAALPLLCTCKPDEVCMIRVMVPTAWPLQHWEPDTGLAFKNTRR